MQKQVIMVQVKDTNGNNNMIMGWYYNNNVNNNDNNDDNDDSNDNSSWRRPNIVTFTWNIDLLKYNLNICCIGVCFCFGCLACCIVLSLSLLLLINQLKKVYLPVWILWWALRWELFVYTLVQPEWYETDEKTRL